MKNRIIQRSLPICWTFKWAWNLERNAATLEFLLKSKIHRTLKRFCTFVIALCYIYIHVLRSNFSFITFHFSWEISFLHSISLHPHCNWMIVKKNKWDENDDFFFLLSSPSKNIYSKLSCISYENHLMAIMSCRFVWRKHFVFLLSTLFKDKRRLQRFPETFMKSRKFNKKRKENCKIPLSTAQSSEVTNWRILHLSDNFSWHFYEIQGIFIHFSPSKTVRETSSNFLMKTIK